MSDQGSDSKLDGCNQNGNEYSKKRKKDFLAIFKKQINFLLGEFTLQFVVHFIYVLKSMQSRYAMRKRSTQDLPVVHSVRKKGLKLDKHVPVAKQPVPTINPLEVLQQILPTHSRE
jgi:hypothetical protein